MAEIHLPTVVATQGGLMSMLAVARPPRVETRWVLKDGAWSWERAPLFQINAVKPPRVLFDGAVDTAATDGGVVYISPTVMTGTEQDEKIVLCYLVHEILGHYVHVDWEADKNRRQPSPFCRAIENVLLDGHDEMGAWGILPRAKAILADGVEAMVAKGGFFDPPSMTAQPVDIFIGWLLVKVRTEALGQKIDLAPFQSAAEKAFGVDLLNAVWDVAQKGLFGAGIVEVIKASGEIEELMKDFASQKPKNPTPEKDQDEGQSSEANSGGAGEGRQSSGADASEGGQPGSGESVPGAGAGAGGDAFAENAKQVVYAKDIQGPDLAEAIKRSGLTVQPHQAVAPLEVSRETYISWEDADLAALGAVRMMASRLEKLLESHAAVAPQWNRENGKLGKLHKLAVALSGNSASMPEVFKARKKEDLALNTSLAVVIDKSASMSGREMMLARTAAVALMDACARYSSDGLETALYSFNFTMGEIKRFNEPWNAATRNVARRVRPANGTLFHSALLTVAPVLAVRNTRRKVLFVLTDGDTGACTPTMIQTLKQQGIEVRVVFIHSNHEATLSVAKQAGIEHWGRANSAAEIPDAVLKSISSLFR